LSKVMRAWGRCVEDHRHVDAHRLDSVGIGALHLTDPHFFTDELGWHEIATPARDVATSNFPTSLFCVAVVSRCRRGYSDPVRASSARCARAPF
jgi:hypothetical protein